MKRFLCFTLVFFLVCGALSALADDPWPPVEGEEEELAKTTITYRGQEYLPEELTDEQIKEAYGWYMGPKWKTEESGGMTVMAVPEDSQPYRSDRANQPSFMVSNFNDEVLNNIEKFRSRVVEDVQSSLRINGYVSYNDNTYFDGLWPTNSVTAVANNNVRIAREIGLNPRVVTPNSAVPTIPVQESGTYSGGKDNVAYVIVEVGPKDASESVMILTHQDTVWDSWRIDYESSKGIINKTVADRWNLGAILSGKEIIEPTTGRTAIIGRGADDDKITAIPEFYALKVLQDLYESGKLPLKRKIQLLLGTNEENGGNRGLAAYLKRETFPKVSYVADVSDGSLRLTQPVFWYARGVISWDNPGNDNVKLRFPAVLEREEHALSNTSTTGGPDTYVRWKAKYNAFHIGSQVGSTQPANAGSAGWGTQAKTAAWLVCDDAATAQNVLASAAFIRNDYIDKYYTYMQNQNYYKPFIKRPTNIDQNADGAYNPRVNSDGSPEGGRWDIGIDIKLVRSPGATFDDTVQIITRGITWRYTEQFGMNSRHILMDLLANLQIPQGKTARWHDAVQRIAKVFPYGQPADMPGKDTWRAAHLFDAIGVQSYFNEFTPYTGTGTSSPANRRISITSSSSLWEIDLNSNVASPTKPGSTITGPYVGDNDENVGMLYFELRFLYPMAPFDDDWFKPSASANNRDYIPIVQAEKVRAAMAAAGIGSTTISGTSNTSTTVTIDGLYSLNQTSGGSGYGSTTGYSVPTYYASFTHDCVQFGLTATNAYYKANGIPFRETLCGQNGTNYSATIRPTHTSNANGTTGFPAAPNIIAGTSVGIGHWGGKNALHTYNERVEPDGLIGYAQRVALLLGEVAAGRYHTYDVSGNGNTQPRLVLRLENVSGDLTDAQLSATTGTTYGSPGTNLYNWLRADMYVQEFTELVDIMKDLRSRGILPAETDTMKKVDFLFGRRFLMKGITTASGGNFVLDVKDLEQAAVGTKQHLLVIGELRDGTWDVINNNSADIVATTVRIPLNSTFDRNTTSSDVVDARVITFLVTEAVTDVAATGVEVLPKTVSLVIGENVSQSLSARVLPDNATNTNVTWSSSNPAVAAVSNSGVVTAGTVAGTATITVTTDDGGHKDTCVVTVTEQRVYITGATVSPQVVEIGIDDTYQLIAVITPSNATDKSVSWSSSNPAVATVSSSGIVTGIANGTAIITMTTADGGYSSTCEVKVSKDGSSCSGCNAGVSVLLLLAVAGLALRRKF